MFHVKQEDSLRARKKRETRQALERAALQLVAENGFDKTTIDDICARANVSRMTFFNYFPTKLAAVLGYGSKPLSAEDLERLYEENPDECYLDMLVSLVDRACISKFDPEMRELRRAALAKDTSLLLKEKQGMSKAHHDIEEALEKFLQAHPEKRMLEDMPLKEEAFLGSSFATYLAQVLFFRHLNSDEKLTSPADIRHLFAAYTQA